MPRAKLNRMELTYFRVGSRPQSGGVGVEDDLDLIAHAAECVSNFFLRSCGVGGVVEAPVVAVQLPWEHRAGLVGIAADGDDGIDFSLQKIIHVFRGVGGNIDPDFGHGCDGLRVYISRWI